MCKQKRQRVSEMVTPSSVVSRAKMEKPTENDQLPHGR